MIDFLVSDHPLAQTLLEEAEFFVYPMTDPQGRASGHSRTNDRQGTIQGSGSNYTVIDHNRFWDIDGPVVLGGNPLPTETSPVQPFEEVKMIREAVLTDTDGEVDWFFDFHSFPSGPNVNASNGVFDL